MAANKRKILEAARKYAQKGAKDRALKEYEQLLRLDPRDARLRLEIGDAQRRWGQVEEAIAAYTKVADQYMKEGFDARAVAVFRQIQNLAPDRFESYEPLAELYQRMGLTAEAIAALQTAADGYHRQGKKREALELLRKMATLDPTNTGSRLKVADLLRQEKLFAEAIDEYQEVAAELQRQGVIEAVGTVLERILELDPKRNDTTRLLAQNLLARGLAQRAEPYAKRLLDANPEGPEYYELLADVYRAQTRESDLTEVYRRLADLYRRRGDEANAREILQRFVPPDALAVGADGGEALLLDVEAGPSERPSLVDDDFLDDGLGEDLLEESAARPAARAVAEPTQVDADDGAAIDVEQLFAEASVYLRYGKRARAIENLHAILVQDPRHRAALEKLGDAHADAREPQEAVEAWLRAAELAREEADLETVAVLRDRIAALDEAAAAQVAEWLPADAAAPELELAEVDESLIEPPDVATEEATDEETPEADLGEIEIDLDGVSLDDDEEAAPTQAAAASDAAPARPETGAGASSSGSLSQQITDDLEEADFYFQQGLHEEAEAIYQRVVKRAPNHPLARVRLGEIAAARGVDPGATGGALAEATPEADEPALAPDPEIGSDLADWNESAAEAAAPAVPQEASADDLEIEFEDEDDVEEAAADAAVADDSTEDEVAPLAAGDDDAIAPADASEDSEYLDTDGDTASDLGTSVPTAPIAPVEEGAFDLAAELSEAIGSERDGGASGADDGFAAVFREFKKGVSRTLDEGDHQAHYDLGIAYREMGLLGDAAAEFRVAMASPARRIDCLHMLGLCALEQGGSAAAVAHFEQALGAKEVTAEQQLAVRFELGRAFEALGDRVRARAAFEAVASVDPAFCDVEERLERLDEEPKPQAPEAAAGFESFEDLIAEGAEAPAAASESFDDVIAEANDEADEAVLLDVPIEAEPAPPPAREPAPRRPVKSGRKKKISFV